MKNIIITAFLFFISVSSIAQNVKRNTYQTPAVASLAAEVKFPISYNSGALGLEIPLYTLKEGDIEIPISMTYDATGVRVGSHPGLTGQNWTLKAGGMITRIVRGGPDEAYIGYQRLGNAPTVKHESIGYFRYFHLLNGSNWSASSMVEATAKTGGLKDLEPDEFIFNFCGQTGKFYCDNSDGKFRVIGSKGYDIKVLIGSLLPLYNMAWDPNNMDGDGYTYYDLNLGSIYLMSQSRIVGFKITDPNGYEYYFGIYEKWNQYPDGIPAEVYYNENFDGCEITSGFFEQLHDEIISTWHLLKVVSPTGRKVEFKYQDGSWAASFGTSYTESNMRVEDNSFWVPGHMESWKSDYNITGSLIRPQYLKSIETENVLINFTNAFSNARSYDYKKIQNHLLDHAIETFNPNIVSHTQYGNFMISAIRSAQNISNLNPYYRQGERKQVYCAIIHPDYLKSLKLNDISINWKHGGVNPIKYTFSYRENSSDRLQLTSIQKKVGSQTMPPYQFSYNNSKKLPDYLDPRTDHWGYYNANSNLSAIVSDKVNYKTHKNANLNYIDSEILEKITYPTGGTKEFIYEPNKYTKIVIRNTTTGVLSVSSTSETIGGGLRIKEIIEKSDATSKSEHRIYTYSDGILNGDMQYNWPNYQGKLSNGNTYTSNRFFSHSILPVSDNSIGGSVGYSKVTETIPGNGKIERTYSNHDTYPDENAITCIDPEKSAYSPFSSRSEQRGKLLTETVFKENNSQPISKTTYTYTPFNTNNYIRSIQSNGYVLFDGITINAIEGSAYKIYTDPVQVATSKEQLYPDNSSIPIETITNYVYNSNFDLETEEVIGSNEGVQTKYKTVTKYVYNCDDADINFSSTYVNRATLTSRNMLKLPITITSYKNDVFDNKIHSRYAYNPNKSDVIYQKFVNKMFGNNKTLALFSSSSVDKKGNYIQYYEISNIGTVLIWGYNYQYLIAEIKNSNVVEVETALGKTIDQIAAGKNPDMTSINNLRTKLKDAQVTTYTYNPLVGLKTTTDPNGFMSYYNYDLMGRLTEIRDHNNNLIESYEYHYNQ